MRRPLTPQMAMTRLAAAAARAEICSHDAAEKLRRWGVSSADAAHILERLIDDGFISDERYARAYVRDKYRFAGWGRRKIAAGLAAKRIHRAIASEALSTAIDPDEYAAKLRAVLRAKARTMSPALLGSFEGRTKLYAFAAQRGFESSLISAAISSVATDAASGDDPEPYDDDDNI